MYNRRKIIIVVAVIIIILAVGIYFWLSRRDTSGPDLTNINQATGGLPGGELPGGQPGVETPGSETPAKVITQADRDKTELQNTAKFFVEMLGSYSPDAKFQNIIDLEPMMTVRMKAWADDFISQNSARLDEYDERITTQVFKTQVMSYNELRARVLLYTRREKINIQGEKLYNQEAEAELVKLGGKWLVDEVVWK